MTAEPTTRPDLDPHRLAGEARSILSCPASVRLVLRDGPELGEVALSESRGTPVLACPPGSAVAAAAAARRTAELRVGSGLARHGRHERGTGLVLTGRLAGHGDDAAVLLVHAVALVRDGEAHEVPVELFRAPEHQLNRGYLQRAADHATTCHQDELRRAVSMATGTPMRELLAAGLADLTPSGVDVDWVDLDGARRSRLVFSRTARTPAELAEVLRRELHAGL